MRFRDALRSDLQDIVDIYNSTVASRIVTADTVPVSVESRVPWFEEHTPHKRPLWIVEEAQHTIGWVSLQSFYGRPAYDATAEISIYLHPSARGKGTGKRVLEHALLQCPALGIKTLLGYIFAHNEPSVRLFRSFGFDEWAMLPNIAEVDGVERSVVIMGRRLEGVRNGL